MAQSERIVHFSVGEGITLLINVRVKIIYSNLPFHAKFLALSIRP